jgi:tetratricopeptide (TPR) repeat protein
MKEYSEKQAWLIKRAKRYARNGNAGAVERVTLDLLRELPDDTVALAMLGAARFQSGRPAEAIVSYERALEVDQDVALLRYQLGLAQAALGRHEEALESWQPLLDDDAEFMAHYQSAMALLALGRVPEAEPLIHIACERMPPEHLLSAELNRMAARYSEGASHH